MIGLRGIPIPEASIYKLMYLAYDSLESKLLVYGYYLLRRLPLRSSALARVRSKSRKVSSKRPTLLERLSPQPSLLERLSPQPTLLE